MMRALDLLRQAIARDPRYAPALGLAGYCRHMIDQHGWTDDFAANRQAGLQLAEQALQIGGDDPVVLAYAGFVLGYFGEDIDAALGFTERALALNPSYALGWMHSGNLNLYAGRTALAIEQLETALRLDPRGNRGFSLTLIGMAYFFDRCFKQASEKLLLSLQEPPSYGRHRFLAASYAHLGRLKEAREIAEALRAITPAVLENATRYATCYRNPEHRELFLSGLRLALGGEAR